MNFANTDYSESPPPSSILSYNFSDGNLSNNFQQNCSDFDIINYKNVNTYHLDHKDVSNNIIKLTLDLTKNFLYKSRISNNSKCPKLISNDDHVNDEIHRCVIQNSANCYYNSLLQIINNLFIINFDNYNNRYIQINENFFNMMMNNNNIFEYFRKIYSIKRNLNPNERFDDPKQCGRQVEFFIKYVVRDITNIYFILTHNPNINNEGIIQKFTNAVFNIINPETNSVDNYIGNDGHLEITNNVSPYGGGTIIKINYYNKFDLFFNFTKGQSSYELNLWSSDDSADFIYYYPYLNELFFIDSKYYYHNTISNKTYLIYIQCMLYFLQNWLSRNSYLNNYFRQKNMNFYAGALIFFSNNNQISRDFLKYANIMNVIGELNNQSELRDKLLGLTVNNYKFTDYLGAILQNTRNYFDYVGNPETIGSLPH
ncbi:MAG: hypothetical protein IJ997_00880 [Mycoplasmataceae bacterium]|nr:hypothetical protein [Mycoplasmataceae bacterium]